MEETRTNLIINYLPQGLTDADFYKMFVCVGPVKSCKIMRDNKTAYSFGFGFVDYISPDDAGRAILQLNNLPIQHKKIKVSYARPPGEDIKETNLYIQNIPRTFSVEDLEELFAPFGEIVQKNLLKDKISGMHRGVGFIRYDKKHEADMAISHMNDVIPDGCTEPLIVKVAEEHGKMKAAFHAGYNAALVGGRGGRGGGRGGYSMGGGYGGEYEGEGYEDESALYNTMGFGSMGGGRGYYAGMGGGRGGFGGLGRGGFAGGLVASGRMGGRGGSFNGMGASPRVAGMTTMRGKMGGSLFSRGVSRFNPLGGVRGGIAGRGRGDTAMGGYERPSPWAFSGIGNFNESSWQ